MYNNYGDGMKHRKHSIHLKRWVKCILIIVLFLTLIYLYSRFIEPKLFKVKEYSIIDTNLSDNLHGFKIVQISDIHYKMTTDKKDLDKIVKSINLLKPDIVIFTGDLFDKSGKYEANDFKDLEESLSNINSEIAKYYISGDNDIYFSNYNEIMENSNFINLNDTHELIYSNGINPILLVGISSNYSNNHIKSAISSIEKNINSEYNYSILVLHEPDFISYIDYSKYNLILAGHSLNGQVRLPIFNGIIKYKYANNYYDEYYDLGNTKLYISSGIGTSKHKLRLLNNPSINFFRLRNK